MSMFRHAPSRSNPLTRGGTLLGAFLVLTSPAVGAEEALTEKLQHGEVNWTERTVLATGSGAPDMKLQNVAQVRLAAERAAQLAAYRNVLEALRGVRVASETLAGDRLQDERVKAQVEGVVRGCKTVDTRYFSDYGVDVVIKCPLDGALGSVLLPESEHKPARSGGEKKYTGLIIDASSVPAKPALGPRVFSGSTQLYGPETVNPSFLRKHGVAAYHGSLEAAKKSPRVGNTPLIVRVSALVDGPSDLKLAAEDLGKLEDIDLGFLSEGRVVIATGP